MGTHFCLFYIFILLFIEVRCIFFLSFFLYSTAQFRQSNNGMLHRTSSLDIFRINLLKTTKKKKRTRRKRRKRKIFFTPFLSFFVQAARSTTLCSAVELLYNVYTTIFLLWRVLLLMFVFPTIFCH